MNRRLYRCRENRVLAGVASGVAEFFDLDPTLVRILWFLSIFVGGVGILLYIGMAIIVPLEPAAAGTAEAPAGVAPGAASGETAAAAAHNHAFAGPSEGHRHGRGGTGRVSMFLGSALILFGSLALLDIALPDLGLSWRQLWPLLIIGLGALLVFGALGRERESSEL